MRFFYDEFNNHKKNVCVNVFVSAYVCYIDKCEDQNKIELTGIGTVTAKPQSCETITNVIYITKIPVYKATLNLIFLIEAEDMESAQDIVSEHILSGQISFDNLPKTIQLGDISGKITPEKEKTTKS